MNDLTAVQLGVRRSAEMAAVFMIGDGLLGLLQPQRHVELWRSDVAAVDALVSPFAEHPRAAPDLWFAANCGRSCVGVDDETEQMNFI